MRIPRRLVYNCCTRELVYSLWDFGYGGCRGALALLLLAWAHTAVAIDAQRQAKAAARARWAAAMQLRGCTAAPSAGRCFDYTI